MSERLDALCGIKNRAGKTYWTKIGVAFPTRQGGGWSLFLDYIPTVRNEDGRIAILLAEPKERDDRAPTRSRRDEEDEAPRGGGKKGDPLDEDEIPFVWAGLVPWIALVAGGGFLV